MKEFEVPIKTIKEWETFYEETFREEGWGDELDEPIALDDRYEIDPATRTTMDQMDLANNLMINRMIALWRVNRRRFKEEYHSNMFGGMILNQGLTVLEITGIIGVAIERLAGMPDPEEDPLEALYRDDSDQGQDRPPG